MGRVKNKIMTLFKTIKIENCSDPTHVNKVYEGQKKPRTPEIKKYISEDNIVKSFVDRIIRGYEEQEYYYKPVREDNFYINNYIEYERSGEKNKSLSIKQYANEIKLNLKDIVNNLQKADKWKIKLRIAINFIYSKDTDEERVMHSKSYNIEIMIYGKAD